MKNLKIIVVLVWFTLLMCNIQAFADQNSFENLHLKKQTPVKKREEFVLLMLAQKEKLQSHKIIKRFIFMIHMGNFYMDMNFSLMVRMG